MNIRHILLLLSLVVSAQFVNAQITWNNLNGTNSWADDGNWDAVAVPTNADAVIFDGTVANDDCVIDATAAEALSITIQNSYSGAISISTGGSLTTGTFTINSYSGTITIDAGTTLTVSGLGSTFTIANVVATSTMSMIINGGFYTGAFSAPRGTINASSAQAFEVDATNYGPSTGAFGISGSTFTAPSSTPILITLGSGSFSSRSTGTFNANGGSIVVGFSANKTFPSGFTSPNGFNNLTLNLGGNAARILTLGGNVDIAGNLTLVSSSTFNLTINGTASQQMNVSGNLDLSSHNATGGTGSSSTSSTQIRLVGNSTQNIIGNSSLTSSAGIIPSLVINQASGGSVSIDGRINLGRNLVVNSNGTITCSSTSVIGFLNSSNAATISGTTSLTSIDFQDLVINKSGTTVSLSSFTPNIRIKGVMTITAGTYTTNGQLTFRSTGTSSSGQLAAVGGALSGSVTVERFIPGSTGRKWRFLASPVTTSNFISNNWQQQIHITGSGTGGTTCPSLTANSNGFDATTQNTPSFYTFSESSNAWTSIASTSGVNLAPKTGYRVFIRGNRSQGCSLLDGTNPTPSDVTLSATGTLVTGTQTINVTSGTGSGWNLVGNPFQAIIDWDNIARSNVGSTYYIFNPNAGVGGAGAYGNYTAGGSGTNGASRYIGPGHSFWVQATGSGSIAVDEADKAVTQTGSATTVFKTSVQNGISIKILDAQNYSDEVLVTFNSGATKCADASLDAEKLQFSVGVGNIATFNTCSSTRYAINTIPEYTSTSQDTIGVHIKVPTNTSANYRLSFDGLTAIPSNLDVYLIDQYTSTYFNLRSNSVYNFSTIANNAATQGANRFSIVIGTGLSALPVKLINFTAARAVNNAMLSWSTASEINSKLFIVERSLDASTFEEIGVVNAKGNSSVLVSYNFNDYTPVLGANNYYRLKAVDKDGKFEYSNIQIVSFDENTEKNIAIATNVYPMPADDHVNLTIASDVTGDISYVVYDVAGNVVSEAVNMPIQNNGELKINLNPSLIGGFYIIELTDDFGNTQRIKFVKK